MRFVNFALCAVLLALLAMPVFAQIGPGPISSMNTWRVEESYSLGQVVIRNGVLYQSLVDSNAAHDPAGSPSQWGVTLGSVPPTGNATAQSSGAAAANITTVQGHIAHICAEDYLYLDTSHSGQDYGTAVNAAILTQQNAYPGIPVTLCAPGQHKVWTPIVDAWNVPLDFENSMLVPQSGGANGIWGSTPIIVAGCTITIGSQNLSCPSIAGLTDRMRIGGVGIPSGAYIQGAPVGTTVHISLQPSLMFNAPTVAASNQLCGVSSEQGLATGQGIIGPPGGTIPASTTITAIARGGGNATQTQCVTMSNNATGGAAAPASIFIASGSTVATTITAEAVTPVITVPFNPTAYRQGTNWSNTFRNIWIVDPGMAVSQTGIGRTLTGVQCFQVYGWDQILQENLHCQGLAGAGLILGGMVPPATLTQGQVVRESKFLNYQIRSTGEPATGQSAVELISGEEGCPSACVSGADEDNTLTLSGNIVYPFAEAVTIATYNTTHTLTNGPRIIHIVDTQLEDTGSTLPKASIAAPFDLIHCIQCGDIYIDDSYLSTSGYGKSVVRVDTGNLVNVTNSQFSDASNLITYTVSVTNGSTLVTYVSGGPGYFENQGLSDGIGGQIADNTGSLCTSIAPCNVYLAPSGAVTSSTTLNLSAPYFGTTGTSTLSVGASGYYWNVTNTLTTFNAMFNYYVDPSATTVSLLALAAPSNSWHVGGAQFPFGTTDYNKQLIAQGASQFIGAATFVSPATGKNYGSFQGGIQAISAKTAAYTMGQTDYMILCNATAAAFAVKLNPAPNTGQIAIIKKTDSSANACTVNGNGKTFDGNATLDLTAQYQVERLQYDGTSWDVF